MLLHSSEAQGGPAQLRGLCCSAPMQARPHLRPCWFSWPKKLLMTGVSRKSVLPKVTCDSPCGTMASLKLCSGGTALGPVSSSGRLQACLGLHRERQPSWHSGLSRRLVRNQASLLSFLLPAHACWDAVGDGASVWASGTHVGEQDGIACSWAQRGPALTVAGMSGVSQRMEDLSRFPCLSST